MQLLSTPSESPALRSVNYPLLPTKLLLPFRQGKCFVPAAGIVALSSERNYTHPHFRHGSTLLYSKPLGEMLARLPIHSFNRIHRSHAVNRQCIRNISKSGVELVDGSVWGGGQKSKRLAGK
ncbi:MAG: LytTR family transcriptional regulator [Bacteroidetes bacterium]|nr:LytTR family transcriptional regulator [Bacteroidota bacterium]